MKFENMKEFTVLAKTRNFLEAAEELYISQSTLSKHIKEMEQELGVILFNRSTRKVSLTEAGLLLLPFAQKAVVLQEEYSTTLQDYLTRARNSLSIGIAFRYREVDIDKYISAFQDKFPHIMIHLFNDESEQLVDMVESGICDCIFIREDNLNNNNLQQFPCAFDYLRVHVYSSHRLADRKTITLGDLENEHFLMADNKNLSYRLGVKACMDAGLRPNIIFQGNRSQVLNCVNKGLGISLLFGNYTNNQTLNNIISLDLTPPIFVHLNLVYKKDNKKDALMNFIKFVQKHPLDVSDMPT